MGRVTLNVLLSFAQFECEVTGERIRDKIAASKKKGLWMGGFVPLGYPSYAFQAKGQPLGLTHAAVRVARELVLEASCDWMLYPSQKVTWPRNRLQFVAHFAACGIKAEEVYLLALLYMVQCCGVEKAELRRGINCFQNLAEIH